MLANRSMPPSTVIPVLAYPDVDQAINWLCAVFGFTVRLRIGNHRAQLNVSAGAVVIAHQGAGRSAAASGETTRSDEAKHSVMVRIDDVDRHHALARTRGARILHPPADYPYGERQYTAEDIAGHRWTFSQSIADVAPEDWGGTMVTTRHTDEGR
jgi:uncharacterized glyoxalase superfamily protein PhnB